MHKSFPHILFIFAQSVYTYIYMLKEKIIKTAINLFSRYGIKDVSIGQIATATHISKNMLYAIFDNKKELLLECLEYEKERMQKIIEKTEYETQNPMEKMILNLSDMHHYRSSFCPAFFRDLQQDPEMQSLMLSNKDKLHRLYMKYFDQGIKEGYFQPTFEYEPIASLFIEQMGDWNNIQQPYIILTFLRGVCTKKGLGVLDCYAPSNVHQ